MEERKWTRLDGASEMQFALRASSEGRSWTGFDAAIYDTSGGLVEVPPSARHKVSMHIGRPVNATCRCDGPIDRRLQSPGDVDIVPIGCSAAWEDDGPTTVLAISLDNSIVRTTAESMGMNADAVSFTPRLAVRDPKLMHIGWAIRAELESGEPNDRLYAESLGTALAAHLLRRYAKVSAAPRRGLTHMRLQRVINYISDNLASNLSLFDLAAIAGMGASSFRMLFKQSVGVPVHQYVIRRRVEAAANLLALGHRRLSEVAIQAGFVDQSHMARCMRRVLGMTPAAVLRQYE